MSTLPIVSSGHQRILVVLLLSIGIVLLLSACGRSNIEITVKDASSNQEGSEEKTTAALVEAKPTLINTVEPAPTVLPTQADTEVATSEQQADAQVTVDVEMPELSGAWRFNFTLAVLDIEFEGLLGFEQEGNQITGLYLLPELGNIGEISGEIGGQTATLIANQLAPCPGTFTMDLTINPDGSSLTGDYTGESCDGPSVATFTGTLISRDASEVVNSIHPLLTIARQGGDIESNTSLENITDDDQATDREVSSSAATNCAGVSGVNFSGQEFIQHRFAGEDLTGANFSQAEFAQPNFRGANLSCTDFSNAVLSQPNFSDATLKGAVLVGADLAQPNLTDTILADASLIDVGLSGGIIQRTNFQRANFDEAVIVDVIFIDANLAEANLGGVSFVNVRWQNTICPDGTNSDNRGGTCQ